MELEFKYIRRTGRLYNGGNETLKYIIETAQVFDDSDDNEINAFYREIGDACESFCKNELMERVCKEGFSNKYSYTLKSSVTQCRDNVLSVLLRAELKNGRKRVSEFVFSNVWSISDRCLMSNKDLVKKYAKNRKIKPQGDFIVKNGELTRLSDVDVEENMSNRKNNQG